MKTKTLMAMAIAISMLVFTLSHAADTAPQKELLLRYSVTVPDRLHYRIPAPGASVGPGRKDGRTWLYEADLYTSAHRQGWLDYVTAYMADREPNSSRQQLGLEIDAGKDGIRDAKSQLTDLEKTFGKKAVKAYLMSEGYDHPLG
jgi:hypothetical protein